MVLGFGQHHSQKDANGSTEERGRDPYIATGRGGAGNVSAIHAGLAFERQVNIADAVHSSICNALMAL